MLRFTRFFGVNSGLLILVRVKYLTFSNSELLEVTKSGGNPVQYEDASSQKTSVRLDEKVWNQWVRYLSFSLFLLLILRTGGCCQPCTAPSTPSCVKACFFQWDALLRKNKQPRRDIGISFAKCLILKLDGLVKIHVRKYLNIFKNIICCIFQWFVIIFQPFQHP